MQMPKVSPVVCATALFLSQFPLLARPIGELAQATPGSAAPISSDASARLEEALHQKIKESTGFQNPAPAMAGNPETDAKTESALHQKLMELKAANENAASRAAAEKAAARKEE